MSILCASGASQETINCLLAVIVSLRGQREEESHRFCLQTTSSGRGRPMLQMSQEQLQ